jgi:cytochrome c553
MKWSSVLLVSAMLLGGAAVQGEEKPDERVDRLTQRALLSDPHPVRGRRLFGEHCAQCHGAKGFGDAEQGVPALAGQRFAYLVRQLANFAGDERDSATMHGVVRQPAIRGPQSWADLAAFLSQSAAAPRPQVGPDRGSNLGRGIFHEQCASCHGADASGDAEGFVPSLRHQHYGYLVKQMNKLAAGYRHNVDESLMLFLRSFDDNDISATADYLSRLQGPGTDRSKLLNNGVAVD